MEYQANAGMISDAPQDALSNPTIHAQIDTIYEELVDLHSALNGLDIRLIPVKHRVLNKVEGEALKSAEAVEPNSQQSLPDALYYIRNKLSQMTSRVIKLEGSLAL